MKKLGLCVRYDCNNFGSMLQIFATQEAIKECNWQCEIIRYDKKNLKFIVQNLSRVFNPYFMRGKIMEVMKRLSLKKHREIDEGNKRRLALFQSYRRQYLGPYSRILKGYSNLMAGAEEYDAVMVGSDQLWTPAGIKTKFYNLLFVPDRIKKISLATSFAVTKVPANQVEMTKEYLSRIDYLSVRESSGAKIIKELIGRDALIAVDPTLLFTQEEWENFFPTKKIINEPYIFAYFLGTTVDHRKAVEIMAKKTDCKIITCPHMDEFVEYDLKFGDEQKFDVDPICFLNLIRGAEYICTDSFHGSIFSILNHKKFVTFNRYSDEIRKGKNTRIDSLLGQLGLDDRRCIDHYDQLTDIARKEIDYVEVDKKLSNLRNASKAFINIALNGD